MDGLHEHKKVFRHAVAELFRRIPPEIRRKFDADVADRVREAVEARSPRTLAGFAALGDEPDLSVFYRRWLADGGRLVLPVWLGGDRMLFRAVEDVDGSLRPGRGGVMEPAEGLREVDAGSIDLAIVPGRAFSEKLDRLGRGAGCYDALLRDGRITGVGVAYGFQVFSAVPHGDGDVPMDAVATPTRLIRKADG